METAASTNLGFVWRRLRGDDIRVLRHGRLVSTIRGKEAHAFAAEMRDADEAAQQQIMARLTGNYKHGNERVAAEHPRNKV